MRYIGGKSLLMDNIFSVITDEIPNVTSVIDLFAGSGVVSSEFKAKGYKVISNDYLYFSYVISRASVSVNKKPTFRKLGIKDPIKYLNELTISDTLIKLEDCFIYNNYMGNMDMDNNIE